ncbi:recombinase-like helix-turn-helix domain-containing protein [Arthrobacter sp. Rue61a]|uniref:recombinase-like helix-turn-helix domain-containing protein n=1 Tax=Arthrobacter sp. Rue61a TaxID=1118963 RepID=UPI00030FAFBA|nr:recombinase-like helix-turn-helix domain-containing protein [Arthrobacter sp. Rue61a]
MPEQYLEANQSRVGPPNPYELKLAGALSEIFASGSHELPVIVSGLNNLGLNAPDGEPWDETRFRSEMRRLGD